MTAVVAGLAIAAAAPMVGAKLFGVVLVVLGGLWMLLQRLEARS